MAKSRCVMTCLRYARASDTLQCSDWKVFHFQVQVPGLGPLFSCVKKVWKKSKIFKRLKKWNDLMFM